MPPELSPGRTYTQNDDGLFVPAIPEPFHWRFLLQCTGAPGQPCGIRFWTRAGYRGHYALAHILKVA